MFEPYVGTLMYFAFDRAPRGWGLCNGQLVSRDTYKSLFDLIHYDYGGTGNMFALPDLRGRAIICQGPNHNMAQPQGFEAVTLNINNTGTHNHGVSNAPKISVSNQSIGADPTGQYMGKPTTGKLYSSDAKEGANAGALQVIVNVNTGGQAFNIMNPYIPINCYIALVGIYPTPV